MGDSKMAKIILITNNKSISAKVKGIAQQNKYDFATYTEDEWATFEDLEQYIQDEEVSKKIIPLPTGYRPVFSLEELEAETIRKVISSFNGNAVKAARALRIGRATLYRKIDKYGLNLKQVRKHQSKQEAENPKLFPAVKKVS